uniref:Uncharacterized protein n=1 Tax=Pyxicephalus adspersus TaxID=30357 RepID=A0AAV2ZV13_PYXAD|nr:TPA: hypothetical protein GDO54_016061 [Pyxicephalus adspersus]
MSPWRILHLPLRAKKSPQQVDNLSLMTFSWALIAKNCILWNYTMGVTRQHGGDKATSPVSQQTRLLLRMERLFSISQYCECDLYCRELQAAESYKFLM